MDDPSGHVAVMGAGSWGTAFAGTCADAGEEVVLWARRAEAADRLRATRRNPAHLGDIPLHDAVAVTADAAQALAGAAVVVVAVPSHALVEQLPAWREHVPSGAIVVSLVKGVVELHGRPRRASEVIGELLGVEPARTTVLSGPNLAAEIACRAPGATVVAGPDPDALARVQRACHTPWFRVYTNPDLIGVELGGAVKNPLAIAAGMADGLGHGDNTKAALLTRGLAEMTRLGVAQGGDPLTFSGLAGVGDLVATCSSRRSRNRTVGEQLGRGRPLADVVREMGGVAEGVRSAPAILAMAAEVEVEMPIVEQVVRVVHDGADPAEVGAVLMGRSPKPELHGLPEGTR